MLYFGAVLKNIALKHRLRSKTLTLTSLRTILYMSFTGFAKNVFHVLSDKSIQYIANFEYIYMFM